jgi:MSHA biogenesis protein MshG
MKKHSDVFPSLMHALVDVGENTGSLDKIFNQIAIHFKRELNTVNSVKAALRYPAMVVITIFVAIGIVNVFVIPAFASFFSKFGAKLPLPTLFLIAMSNFIIHYWYLVVAGIIATIVAWVRYINSALGRMKWDRWKIRLPLIGNIIEKSLLARFARSFALCSKTGVPLLEAITIIAKTTDNVFVAGRIIEMRTNIEHGDTLTNSARISGMFTPLVLQMMSIGEETGDLDRLLDEVADFYEQEVDYDLKKLSEAIEPILISIVAVMVLILALGVFLPMWDISRVAISKA